MQYEPLPRKPWAVQQPRPAFLHWCAGAILLVCMGTGWTAGWILHHQRLALHATPVGLRCHVYLPATVRGWNTLLAECDGRPVAIGAPQPQSQPQPNPAGSAAGSAERNRAADWEVYAKDMQAIRGVLSSEPAPTPAWVVLTALLLLPALLGGLVILFRGLFRELRAFRRPVPAAPSLPGAVAIGDQSLAPGIGPAVGQPL
jgi:hypothetical protein